MKRRQMIKRLIGAAALPWLPGARMAPDKHLRAARTSQTPFGAKLPVDSWIC
jgi:hypothetical protein